MSGALVTLAHRFGARWTGPRQVTFFLPSYEIDYFFRSSSALVVAFDHMLSLDTPPPERRLGWASKFLKRKGISALHVKPRQNCWYRRPDLEEFFRALDESGLAGHFDTVMTYGSSMGGFGALSFARLVGARRCLALNPQVNLGPSVRAWEKRFRAALRQDWTGELCDVSRQIASVQTVAVAYDPYFKMDRQHVELLTNAHLIHLRLPFVAHNIPYLLVAMRTAETVFDACLDGTLSEAGFRRLARRRRQLLRWRNNLLARSEGRPKFVRTIEARAGTLGIA